ncbi:MAG: ATP12 family chaperone protein [Candidatus Puniceispirillaceae bacterium]
MEKKAAKRFYKQVSVAEENTGFTVMLDNRQLKTPAVAPLILPNESLAKAICAEFDAQQEEIEPQTMPIFSLSATAIDRVMTQRKVLDDELVRFGHNDLISYRCSTDEDVDLASRQEKMWGAIQNWLADNYEISLMAFEGIMPKSQPEAVTTPMQKAVQSCDHWRYVALYRATTLTGSLALGLAFTSGHLTVADLMSHAFLDEIYQEEKWGVDEWALERRDAIMAELTDAFSYMALLDERHIVT